MTLSNSTRWKTDLSSPCRTCPKAEKHTARRTLGRTQTMLRLLTGPADQWLVKKRRMRAGSSDNQVQHSGLLVMISLARAVPSRTTGYEFDASNSLNSIRAQSR